MIRNTKNIKQIKLLYENIEENNSQKENDNTKVNKNEGNEGDKNIKVIDLDIFTNNIKGDLLKTFVFIFFAGLILFTAYTFTSESTFATELRNSLNLQPIFLR